MEATKTRIKWECKDCGSDAILKEAWAEWDVENQQWTLSSDYDEFFCEGCSSDDRPDKPGGDGHLARVVEVDICTGKEAASMSDPDTTFLDGYVRAYTSPDKRKERVTIFRLKDADPAAAEYYTCYERWGPFDGWEPEPGGLHTKSFFRAIEAATGWETAIGIDTGIGEFPPVEPTLDECEEGQAVWTQDSLGHPVLASAERIKEELEGTYKGSQSLSGKCAVLIMWIDDVEYTGTLYRHDRHEEGVPL